MKQREAIVTPEKTSSNAAFAACATLVVLLAAATFAYASAEAATEVNRIFGGFIAMGFFALSLVTLHVTVTYFIEEVADAVFVKISK